MYKPTITQSIVLAVSFFMTATVSAVDYEIDTKGAHAFIEFRIKHLGYSWLLGRFNRFKGEFSYDKEHPELNKTRVSIEMASLDSNHGVRDKHLRSERFFDVETFPVATFVSSAWEQKDDGSAILKGKLTMRGITKDIEIAVTNVGNGPDPWGGYRRGFEGNTLLHLSDWNMKEAKILGDAAEEIRVYLSIEGIRK